MAPKKMWNRTVYFFPAASVLCLCVCQHNKTFAFLKTTHNLLCSFTEMNFWWNINCLQQTTTVEMSYQENLPLNMNNNNKNSDSQSGNTFSKRNKIISFCWIFSALSSHNTSSNNKSCWTIVSLWKTRVQQMDSQSKTKWKRRRHQKSIEMLYSRSTYFSSTSQVTKKDQIPSVHNNQLECMDFQFFTLIFYNIEWIYYYQIMKHSVVVERVSLHTRHNRMQTMKKLLKSLLNEHSLLFL